MNRRHFLLSSGLALAGCAVTQPSTPGIPVAIFSKVFQEIPGLTWMDRADLVAEAGLDGVDCPVRPGGEIEPEKVTDKLADYAAALRGCGRKLLLLTTAITSPSSPHAERILRAARELGVTHYRTGYWRERDGADRNALRANIRSQFRDLADMNRALGMCGGYQNHSGGDYVGRKLEELPELFSEIDPKYLGLAFDPSHGWIEHGREWVERFRSLQPHVAIAYFKDVNLEQKFCRFGDGVLGSSPYFQELHKMGYSRPISMHTEYDWSGGKPKSPQELLAVLRRDGAMLRSWLTPRASA